MCLDYIKMLPLRVSNTAFECNDRALQENGRPSVVPLAAQECSVHVLDVNESPWQ